MLTLSKSILLATAQVDGIKYKITAVPDPDEDQYIGWITHTAAETGALGIDDGAFVPQQDLSYREPAGALALTVNEVSIEQSLSSEFAVIGDQVTVSIAVTNKTSNALSDESVSVFFILDDAEFIDSSPACAVDDSGPQTILRCAINSLAPAATTSFEYTVETTANSYPQLASSVFLGDAFGQSLRDDAFIFVVKDTLKDSDSDGISDVNEALLGTDPQDSASSVGADFIAQTDLLFLYSQKFLDSIGDISPETHINQLVEVTNTYFADSGALVRFRPVFYGFTDFDTGNDLNRVMDAMSDATGVFSELPELREKVGADITVFIDGLFPGGDACGLGPCRELASKAKSFTRCSPAAILSHHCTTQGFQQKAAPAVMTLRWLTSWDITMVWRIRAGNQEPKAPTPGPSDTEWTDPSLPSWPRRMTIPVQSSYPCSQIQC